MRKFLTLTPTGILSALFLVAIFALTQPRADKQLIQQKKNAETELKEIKRKNERIKVTQDSSEHLEEKLEWLLEATRNNNELVDKFETLKNKSEITSQELLRFKTLQSELEHATSSETLEKVQGELNSLKKKSKLTSFEFNELMETQDLLIQVLPEKALLYDEYGNVIIFTQEDLLELTESELERLQTESYEELLENTKEINSVLED